MPVSASPIGDLYGTGSDAVSQPSWLSSAPAAAFGTKPAPVQPIATAPAAVGTAMNLGNQVYNQLPGYQQSLGNVGANIQSETAGVLPADVVTQITNEAAARGVASGTGADTVNANLLKSLGLTSLNLTEMGQQGLDTQLGMLPGAQLYQNPSFYPNTSQTYEAGVQNNLNAAAPDPFAAGNASIRAAAGGVAAGKGMGGGGLPAGTTLPSTANPPGTATVGTGGGGGSWIPGVPLGQPSTQDVISQILDQYNPENPASSETATTDYEQDQVADTLGSLEGLYGS